MRRTLLLLIGVVLLASWAESAVTIDAVNSSGSSGDFGDDTFSHTVSASANLLLVCAALGANGTLDPITSITYAGQALTFLAGVNSFSAARAELWYKLAPIATGTPHDVVVDASGDDWFVYTAISLIDVDQVAPTHVATASAATNIPSVTVTSAVGEFVLDCLGAYAGGATLPDPTEGSGQTQRWLQQHDTIIASFGSTKAGAASPVPMSWTLDQAYFWAQVGVSLAPSSAPVGGGGRRRMVIMP